MTHTISDLDQENLAVPITDLWDEILMLPLVGPLDSARSVQVMEQLCSSVERSSARVVIIDILGVPTVDSKVAQQIIDISRAVSLMGANCVLTGISPPIAQALVRLKIDLGDIITRSRLRDGVLYAFSTLNLKVIESDRGLK